MNELYISDSSIYFKTSENTYDEAMDEFLSKCACEVMAKMKECFICYI